LVALAPPLATMVLNGRHQMPHFRAT
jgi:hypothetical protein